MIISEDQGSGSYRVQAYEPGIVRINNHNYQHSVIVTKDALLTDWPPQCLAELQAEHLQVILQLQPEIVLLGSGKRFILPNTELLADLYNQQIGVECMDTAAACRTFTALMAEDRNVVAALLIN